MAEDTPLVAPNVVEEHAGQVQPEKEKRTPEDERVDLLIQEIRENFAFVTSVENEQRRLEEDDLEFEEGAGQWLPEHIESRKEQTDSAGRKIPARPRLTVNLLDQPIQQVIDEARRARLTIAVAPKAGLGNTKTADRIRGLMRVIQAESGATSVRLWALERATKCGRGSYRVLTEFANDGDFDLDIVIKRILNQGTVYYDPYHQAPDASDAEWCLITDWMSEDDRLRKWPTKPLQPTDNVFDTEDDPWFARDPSTKKRSVRIAEYYRVEHRTRLLVHHPTTGTRFADELPPELRDSLRTQKDVRTREVDVRTIRYFIVDGTQILEEEPWDGRFIPVPPVIGKEYVVKGKRSWKGVVRNPKDAQRGYNVATSSAVELAGAAPRSPYIMYEGQDEGFEDMWDDSPIRNYTRLYVKSMTVDGKPAPFPQRQQTEPQIQATMFLAQSLKNDVHTMVGTVDPASRAVRPYDRSGKAIEALQRQGQAGSSNYLDNLATISMMYEGRILLDLIPKVYDRPGRVLNIMGDEEQDTETAILIKQPFIVDGDGNPVAVPCPICQGRGEVSRVGALAERAASAIGMRLARQTCPACGGTKIATKASMPKEWQGKPVEYVDFSEGQYKVTVSIGRFYASQQEEAMAAMSDLAKAAPPLVPIYADLWVRSMGFPGATEIADRLKRQNPAAQGEDANLKDVPPKFLQQFMQLKAEHEQAMQALQQATDKLKTDAIKGQTQKEIAAMKIEAQAGLENLKGQGDLLKTEREGAEAEDLERLRGALEAMRQESEQRHEVLLELLKAKLGERAAVRAEAHEDVRAEQDRALEPPAEGD